MAENRTQWEVVGKGSKKTKKTKQQQNSGKMNKNEIRAFIENMPTVKDMAPVKESATIFDAFLAHEKKVETATKTFRGNGSKNDAAGKKQANKKKQQPPDRKKTAEDPSYNSLEEALEKLNVGELSSFLSLVQERFPSTPLIWLKDLVTYLNVKLNVTVQDPIYSGKPVDYPLSIVPRDVLRLTSELFDKCPDAVLHLFFEHVVSSLVEDTVRGLSTSGYRIVIQSLAFSKPAVTLNNLQKFKDLRSQYQNRQPVCLSILWALGQGGVRDLSCGLKIWLEMMVPIVGLRAYSKYIVDYLDVLFCQHSDVLSCGQVLGIREFFPVLDMIFSHSANLPVPLHKQLLGLYPKLKTVAFGPDPEQVLRNFFPSFLVRLEPGCPLLLRNELQSCLTMCLATDKHSYSVWRQLYTKHLLQSSLLMQHLLDEWDALGSGLPKKMLKETLGTFRVTNEELGVQGKGSVEGYPEAVKVCEALLRKMSMAAMLPWRLILFLLVMLVGGTLVYDVQTHGSFKASTTGKVLHDIGFISICDHAWFRIQVYSGKIYRWSEENVPHCYYQVCEWLDPYVKLFWRQLYAAGLFVVDQSWEVRRYLNQKLPQLLQWVDDNVPSLMQTQVVVLWDAWAYAKYCAAVVVASILHYLQLSGTWLQENVFTGKLSPENLQKCTQDTVEVVQEYTSAAYQWVAQQYAALTSN